jgi:hypothetical protein
MRPVMRAPAHGFRTCGTGRTADLSEESFFSMPSRTNSPVKPWPAAVSDRTQELQRNRRHGGFPNDNGLAEQPFSAGACMQSKGNPFPGAVTKRLSGFFSSWLKRVKN